LGGGIPYVAYNLILVNYTFLKRFVVESPPYFIAQPETDRANLVHPTAVLATGNVSHRSTKTITIRLEDEGLTVFVSSEFRLFTVYLARNLGLAPNHRCQRTFRFPLRLFSYLQARCSIGRKRRRFGRDRR
jgi:hypothetical protein